MNRKYVIFIVSFVAIFGIALGYRVMYEGKSHEATFEQLSISPNKFSGKKIVIEGFYFHGWETVVLCETLELSGYAEGHLTPRGEMIWVEDGIPFEVYEALHTQEMMGPLERFGKIRVQGRYEYGGDYGHLGGFNSRIIPSVVKLLPWSP